MDLNQACGELEDIRAFTMIESDGCPNTKGYLAGYVDGLDDFDFFSNGSQSALGQRQLHSLHTRSNETDPGFVLRGSRHKTELDEPDAEFGGIVVDFVFQVLIAVDCRFEKTAWIIRPLQVVIGDCFFRNAARMPKSMIDTGYENRAETDIGDDSHDDHKEADRSDVPNCQSQSDRFMLFHRPESYNLWT